MSSSWPVTPTCCLTSESQSLQVALLELLLHQPLGHPITVLRIETNSKATNCSAHKVDTWHQQWVWNIVNPNGSHETCTRCFYFLLFSHPQSMTASILIEEKPWAALVRPHRRRPCPRFRRQRSLCVAALSEEKLKRKKLVPCTVNLKTCRLRGFPDAMLQMKNVDLKTQTGLVQCLYLNLLFSFNKVQVTSPEKLVAQRLSWGWCLTLEEKSCYCPLKALELVFYP